MTTLGDRCFAHNDTDPHDELFVALQVIFDGKVVDTWTDSYDASVEIVLTDSATPMTREQANAILALGFGRIYESQGERGILWGPTGSGPCSPRKAR